MCEETQGDHLVDKLGHFHHFHHMIAVDLKASNSLSIAIMGTSIIIIQLKLHVMHMLLDNIDQS